MCEQSAVGSYYRMAPKDRLNHIVVNFHGFPAMVNNYEMEVEDHIRTGRSKARQESLGDLGVRIQTGTRSASPTEGQALDDMRIEEIIKTGEMPGAYRNIADYDDIVRGLKEIRLMRREYKKVRNGLNQLPPADKDLLLKYVSRQERTAEMSVKLMVSQEAVKNRMYRIKQKLITGLAGALDTYTDESIVYLDI